jgi:hypothetical protein
MRSKPVLNRSSVVWNASLIDGMVKLYVGCAGYARYVERWSSARTLRKHYALRVAPSHRTKRLRACRLPAYGDGDRRTENPLVLFATADSSSSQGPADKQDTWNAPTWTRTRDQRIVRLTFWGAVSSFLRNGAHFFVHRFHQRPWLPCWCVEIA